MKLISTITVPQTQQQVWEFLSNPLNANKWDRSIKEVVLPNGVFSGKGCVVETISPGGMRQSFTVTEFASARFLFL